MTIVTDEMVERASKDTLSAPVEQPVALIPTHYCGTCGSTILSGQCDCTKMQRPIAIGDNTPEQGETAPSPETHSVPDDLPIFADGGLGQRLLSAIEACVEDYVFSLDDYADHEPTDDEKAMLIDFINTAFSADTVNRILQDAAKATVVFASRHNDETGECETVEIDPPAVQKLREKMAAAPQPTPTPLSPSPSTPSQRKDEI